MTAKHVATLSATCWALLSLSGCGKAPSQPPEKPTVSPFVAMARGRVDVEGGLIHLASPRDGIVKHVDHNVGESVKSGDVLVVLDTTQFEFARDAARADVATAEAQVQLLRARAVSLKTRSSRTEQAARAGATSDQVADDARQAVTELNLETAAAQSAVDAAKQKVRQAEYEIEVRTIRAPAAGKIVSRGVRTGEAISTVGNSLIDLVPDGPRIVRSELNEGFVSKVDVGMPAEVVSQADETRKYPARVVRVGEVFGPSRLTETTQEATDARDVECILDVGDAPLRIGERVTVKFLANAAKH